MSEPQTAEFTQGDMSGIITRRTDGELSGLVQVGDAWSIAFHSREDFIDLCVLMNRMSFWLYERERETLVLKGLAALAAREPTT